MTFEEYERSKLYRMQGLLSRHLITLGELEDEIQFTKNYMYFSSSLDHHLYYSDKRIFQLIYLQILGHKKVYPSFWFDKNADYIRELVSNYAGEINFESLSLCMCSSFVRLLEENSVIDRDHENRNIPAQVDKTKGGGYHIRGLWFALFKEMILALEYKKLDSKEPIISSLTHENTYMNATMHDFSRAFCYCGTRMILNQRLYSGDAVDKIIDILKEIYYSGFYQNGSSFAQNPNKVIDELIGDYTRKREIFIK